MAHGDLTEATPETSTIFVEAEKDLSDRSAQGLGHTLKARHLNMIALGGIIGAGFFVGSSTAILAAGPAVLISIGLSGLLIILVMRMLGELATASPDTGSFSAYAAKFIGPWAGTAVGLIYWWFWTVVVGIEATAAAQMISAWWPAVPQWLGALVLIVLFLVLNLISVRFFGETEFWLASVKVGAIVAFIVVGILLVVHIIPNDTATVANLVALPGGFAPNGVGGILQAILPALFGMVGAEVATIAAAESENPKQAVWRAVKSVVWRILLFFLGSLTIVLVVTPWTNITAGISPFVVMLETAGIPWAGLIMAIVVLSAVLSTLNAALYTASRMIFSLAGRGDVPARLRRVSSRGTPTVAILVSTVVGLACVVLNYVAPSEVFSFLVNSITAIYLFVWITIAVSQLRSRRLLGASTATVRMWGHPWLGLLVIAALLALIVYIFFTGPRAVLEMSSSLSVVLIAVVVGLVLQRRKRRTAAGGTVRHEQEQ